MKSRSGVPARRVRPKAPCSSCSVVKERSPTFTWPGPPGAARSRRSTRSSATGTPPSAMARPRARRQTSKSCPAARTCRSAGPGRRRRRRRRGRWRGAWSRSRPSRRRRGRRSACPRRSTPICSSVAPPVTNSRRWRSSNGGGAGASTNSLSPRRVTARLRSPPICSRERAGQLGVGEVGDRIRRPSSVTEPPNSRSARLLVGEQAVAQRVGGDARHLELDRVDGGIARGEVVEREHGLLVEAGPDRLGDLLQLGAVDAIDVEAARALERRVPESEEKKTPSSSCEPRGVPPPAARSG